MPVLPEKVDFLKGGLCFGPALPPLAGVEAVRLMGSKMPGLFLTALGPSAGSHSLMRRVRFNKVLSAASAVCGEEDLAGCPWLSCWPLTEGPLLPCARAAISLTLNSTTLHEEGKRTLLKYIESYYLLEANGRNIPMKGKLIYGHVCTF